MTISALGVVAVYAGSGSVGPFSLVDSAAQPILFSNDNEIGAQTFVNPDDSHPTQLTQGVDYTLTGAGSPTAGSLTLTVPLAAGKTLMIIRRTAATQTLDLTFGGDLSLENLEALLDKQTRLLQELREQTGRSLLFMSTHPTLAEGAARVVPVPVAGNVLAWNSTADRLINALGHLFYSGSGAPAGTLGGDGDFYIDTAGARLYGPKTAGAWGSGVSVVGPQGIQGIQGIQGPPGPNGPGTGDVLGAASSTDNAVVRFDLATGKLIQNSVVLIGDTGAMTGVLSIDLPNAGLKLRDTNASHTLQVTPGSDLTANRIWTVITGDADRTLDLTLARRDVLTATRTYFVRTDGNDANTGLVDNAGGAFLTVQKAINVVYGTLDLNSFDVLIQVRTGTFARAIIATPQTGKGNITLQGDVATPANVTLTSTTLATTAGVIDVQNGAVLTVQGFTLTCAVSGSCMFTANAGAIIFNAIRFGTTPGSHILASQGGLITANGDYSIVGNVGIHWWANDRGGIRIQSRTVTLTGTPAFASFFCQADYAGIATVNGNTYSGSGTGPRFHATANGVIVAFAGINELPGNAAGTVDSGGIHPALNDQESLIIAVSDETTTITTGTAKVTFRMPYAFTLTELPRASLSTASSSGIPAVDINEAGASIFSTGLTIDANEKTSTTAATPAVLSDLQLGNDAEITVDIDTAGTGAKGLKITLIGYRT